jgi:hypothetical protein
MEEKIRDGSSTRFLGAACKLNKPLTFREALEDEDGKHARSFRYTEQPTPF